MAKYRIDFFLKNTDPQYVPLYNGRRILKVQKMFFCGLLKNYLKDQNVLKLSGCLKEVFLVNRTMDLYEKGRKI